MEKYKFGIIGVGKMGGSILSGILKSGIYNEKEILLFDTNQEIIDFWTNKGIAFSSNEKELFSNVEMALIAIKPQMFSFLKKYSYEDLNMVIISIAAGKTIKDLQDIFGNQKFIRVMPNTPALIGLGASAISRTDNIDDVTFETVKTIFSSIGIVEEIEDGKMNEIIPVNGSMPAYLYYFAKAFIENAVEEGIDYDVAKKLASYAIIGSAKMILETDKSIEELIKDVCSPKGATLEGLKVFDDNKVNDIIKKASKACIQRAYELSKIE